MSSKIEICNLALDRLGEDVIVAITDTNPRAEALNRAYLPTLKEILRVHPWNFAMERATITVDATAPDFLWASRFALPSNFVRLIKLNGTEADSQLSDNFKIEGQWILTDATECKIEYVKFPEGSDDFTENFDPLFQDAFVTLLASKIAPKIVEDGADTLRSLKELYLRIDLPLAQRMDKLGEKKPIRDVFAGSRIIAEARTGRSRHW